METITLKIKEKKQFYLLQEFLQHLDFITIVNYEKNNNKNKKHSILDSAGIWENRNINQQSIREKLWKRN